MSNTLIVVKEGTILCEHGGKVVLNSTVTNHKIGGKTPMYDIDLLDAEIQGCPHLVGVGGQCTKVVAISSAVTESNIANKGKNYLLRVDGCKTDKGAGLVLVDPGQDNTHVHAKQSGEGASITLRALEEATTDTKENIKKERHRIYPLRNSGVYVRGLRGGRDFRLLNDFYSLANGTHKADKLLTYTDAYLYVTDINKNETIEYQVINRGDIFNPKIQDIQFKDTQTGAIRRYIPCYEESTTLEFVYSNLKLSEQELQNFKPLQLNLTDATNSCTPYPKEYAKSIKLVKKDFQKRFTLSYKALHKEYVDITYVNTLLLLDDPLGEIEDLYNEYEFSYNYHYGYNKALIENIKAKNQYAYAVADMLDYLYVSDAEQQKYDAQTKKLKEKYKILANIICNEFADFIVQELDSEHNLASVIQFDTAKDFLDEVKFISPFFFDIDEGALIRDDDYSKEHFYLMSKRTAWVYTGNRNTLHKHSRSIGMFGRGILSLNGGKYTTIRKHPSEVLALLIFTLCFDKKYEKDLENNAALKEASEEFYYLLKTAKPLPLLNEKSLGEVREYVKSQIGILDIVNGKDKLLEEYEALDAFHANSSFLAKKNYNDDLNALYNGGISKKLYTNKHLASPLSFAKKIAKALSSTALSQQLKEYKEIKIFASSQEKIAYCNYALNLSCMLIAPRAMSDSENEMLCPFNKEYTAVQEWLVHTVKSIDALSEDEAIELHAKKSKEHYLKALYLQLSYAYLSKNPSREKNAKTLLETLDTPNKKVEANLSNINDHNFAKDLAIKTEVEELYERLKMMDGISSKLPDLDEKVRKEGAFSEEKSSGGKYDANTNKTEDLEQSTWPEKISKQAYQTALSSLKGLAFFMTVANVAEYLKGNEKSKLHNLVQVSNDLFSLTGSLAQQGKKLSGGNLKALSEVIDTNYSDKTSSTAKFIVRLGVVGVILNSVNEYESLDKDDNDAKAALASKSLLIVALMLTPGWVAFGAIIVIELAWLLLKERVVDSSLEVYLKHNLFHNDRTNYDVFKSMGVLQILLSGAPIAYRHLAPSLLDAVHSEATPFYYKGADRKSQEIQGFSDVKEIRTFIAENYDTHAKSLERAMLNELSEFKAVLYGYKVEILDKKTRVKDLPLDDIYYQTILTLPQEILENNRHILFYKDKKYEKIDTKSLAKDGKSFLFDTAKDIRFTTIDALQKREGEEIAFLIINKDIALKYTMQYHVRFENIGYYSGSSNTLLMLDKLENVGLTAQDIEHIESLENKGN